ncbi:MAG: histidine kinase, partial [Lachnospiraceae bacterium]|nr:histidine kinase [Lachnospiraceae bacterium]
IDAVFLSFWEETGVHPYAAGRGDFGFSAQRNYRERIEADVLEKMSGIDTDILLLEYDGDLYVARNLLDSHFNAYATVVLLCDLENLFQSLNELASFGGADLMIDEALVLDRDGTLKSVSDVNSDATVAAGEQVQLAKEVSGHSLVLTTQLAPYNVWRNVPQIRMAVLVVVLLVLPMLLAVIFLFRSYVTRPVDILVDANNRLENGERGYHIDAKANSREFARLYAHFNTMSAELKNQFERSYLEQQATQQAQIKALQSQINPHFLNNTLEVINWEARLAGCEDVSAMIEALSTMMDGALGRDGRSQVPLRTELGYVDAYLYIIRQRLGERLKIHKEIDDSLLDTLVPRLILQPLAENAVEHDLTPRRGGYLCLRAYREEACLVLEVEHDGAMSDEDLAAVETLLASGTDTAEVSGKVGLRNVCQRLRLLYGEAGELSIRQMEGERILTRVSFPVV